MAQEEKRDFLTEDMFACEQRDSTHVSEAAFRLLRQMKNTDTSWQTMNQNVVVSVNCFNSTEHISAK